MIEMVKLVNAVWETRIDHAQQRNNKEIVKEVWEYLKNGYFDYTNHKDCIVPKDLNKWFRENWEMREVDEDIFVEVDEDIFVWPNGSWCFRYEYEEFGPGMSDDFKILYWDTEEYNQFLDSKDY